MILKQKIFFGSVMVVMGDRRRVFIINLLKVKLVVFGIVDRVRRDVFFFGLFQIMLSWKIILNIICILVGVFFQNIEKRVNSIIFLGKEYKGKIYSYNVK